MAEHPRDLWGWRYVPWGWIGAGCGCATLATALGLWAYAVVAGPC